MATAYQGNKPYIFLNYSHRDKELADYVVDYLQEYNFNVWYDEGIPSGTRWENVMIDKITNCSVMVFLVTKNSLASDWCKQELRFAKEEGKKFINVVIGKPTIPDWFKLSYADYQFLYEKNFPNREAMMDKLVKELIHHAMNTDKPTDTPKETPKAKPLPTAKAPWVCKSCGSNNSGDDDVCEVCGSSDRYVAPKASPVPSFTEGLEFSIVDGTAHVDRYKGTDTKVIIPATIIRDDKTYKVTSIGENAFLNCKNLTSITIPNSVTSIGEWAFWGCSSLTAINVDKNNSHYRSIDGNLHTKDGSTLIQYAIGKTTTSFTIPDGVTTIGANAFWGCKNLTSISIPNSVITIERDAFRECNISSITIPNSVRFIRAGAFRTCNNLYTITIPNSVTTVDNMAFEGCKNLTIYCEAKSKPTNWHTNWNPDNRPVVWGCESSKRSVAPKASPAPSFTEGLEFSIVDGTARVDRYKGTDTNVIIPATIIRDGKTYKVTAISEYAFYGCTNPTSITIPESVTSIGNWAFNACSSLTSIVVDENNQNYKSIDGNLYSKDGSTLIQYAIGKTSTSFTIPDSVTSIGGWAFAYCTLTSVTIPDSVTSICEIAFFECSSLTSIVVDANNQNYKSIDGNLYSKDGTTLIQYAIGKTATSFTIPNSVTSIGYGAFYKCENLTSISIPKGVKSIGKRAFAWCENLTSISIPDSVTSIGEDAFFGCSSLTSISIPKGVKSIGMCAFYCKNLTIYCEAKSKPRKWDTAWNGYRPVVWRHKIN